VSPSFFCFFGSATSLRLTSLLTFLPLQSWESTLKDPCYTLFTQNPHSFLTNFANFSPEAVPILVGMLAPDPTRRIGLFQVKKMVEKVGCWKVGEDLRPLRLQVEASKLIWDFVPTSNPFLVHESEESE